MGVAHRTIALRTTLQAGAGRVPTRALFPCRRLPPRDALIRLCAITSTALLLRLDCFTLPPWPWHTTLALSPRYLSVKRSSSCRPPRFDSRVAEARVAMNYESDTTVTSDSDTGEGTGATLVPLRLLRKDGGCARRNALGAFPCPILAIALSTGTCTSYYPCTRCVTVRRTGVLPVKWAAP